MVFTRLNPTYTGESQYKRKALVLARAQPYMREENASW